MYLNKVYLYGNLTRDPEMKSLPSGSKVTQFSLATNRVYKDQAGARQEQTEYHNIVVFGRQAETSAQYLKKGQGVLIEGRIQTRSWDDKTTGEKKYRTEIIADAVQFGPKGGASVPSGEGYSPTQSSNAQTAPQTTPDLDTIDYGDANVNVDDIPF
jgi:single-strand DNA-binding protein